MTKAAAIYEFFSSFGIRAYEENSIYETDDEIQFPYITYELKTDSFNDANSFPVSVSLWYRSPSLVEINAKAEEISRSVGNNRILRCDGGFIKISRGHPFAQTMGNESDDMIKRKVLAFDMTFYTEF